MASKLLGMALVLIFVAACAEKPQESGPSDQLAEAHSRGTSDPMDSRTQRQDEAARIYH